MPIPVGHMVLLLTATAALVLGGPPSSAQPLAVTVRNTVNLPATATDQSGTPFTITGLSGVTFRGSPGASGTGGEFVAVMDNSNKLVRLQVAFGADGTISSASVLGGLSLEESRDFEGIAFSDTYRNRVFLSEEGVPVVREFSLSDGSLLRVLDTPAVYLSRRDNFGFESLSRRGSTGEVWTGNEEALTADGPLSTASVGTTVRLLKYQAPSLTPGPQFAYTTQPWHGSSISGARSGLSDLVILPNGRLVSLERSFAASLSGFFQTRIYEVTLSGATDVSGLASLSGTGFVPVSKRLLWSGNLNNLEGLCLGPRLSSGHYVLLGVVDDGDPISLNALTSFDLTGAVCVADANSDGTVTIQDLFDFLALYFAGGAAADVNGSGTTTVQDIFDFLAAYFVGC